MVFSCNLMQENTTISESGTETSSEACVEKVLVSVRPEFEDLASSRILLLFRSSDDWAE